MKGSKQIAAFVFSRISTCNSVWQESICWAANRLVFVTLFYQDNVDAQETRTKRRCVRIIFRLLLFMDTYSSTPAADLAIAREPLSLSDISDTLHGENTPPLPEPELLRPPSSPPLRLKKRRALSTPSALLYPLLEVETILAWADAYHARTGSWPTSTSGNIPESSGDTWQRINAALNRGLRGLMGGSSLAQLLAHRRGKRNRKALPVLTTETILAWADAHQQRTGEWPTPHSGEVQDASGETWTGVQMALAHGQRGMPGGSSLARLLEAARGRPCPGKRSRLTTEIILAWADTHRKRTGQWPTLHSGDVLAAPGETWMRLQGALRKGQRGLPGESSLARLLTEQRGARNQMRLPPLVMEQILTWADTHHERTGQWPTSQSGQVQDAPEER